MTATAIGIVHCGRVVSFEHFTLRTCTVHCHCHYQNRNCHCALDLGTETTTTTVTAIAHPDVDGPSASALTNTPHSTRTLDLALAFVVLYFAAPAQHPALSTIVLMLSYIVLSHAHSRSIHSAVRVRSPQRQRLSFVPVRDGVCCGVECIGVWCDGVYADGT